MIGLDQGRTAAIRNLDAAISRLQGLGPLDWSRSTPCREWDIEALASHVGHAAHYLSGYLAACITQRTGEKVELDDGSEAYIHTSMDDLMAHIIHGRNQLNAVMEALIEDDLAAVAGQQSLTGRRVLTIACVDFGLHRFDLETAMGERYAGIDADTVIAGDELFGKRLPLMAKGTNATPDRAWSIRLSGDDLDRWLTWDGATWSGAECPGIPVTVVRGDDSAIVLFVCGRILAGDHRLEIEGDPAVADAFKTFIPGP